MRLPAALRRRTHRANRRCAHSHIDRWLDKPLGRDPAAGPHHTMTQAQLEKLFGKGAYEKAQQITPVTDELQLERIISWLRLIHLANNTKPHRDDLRRTLLLIPEDDRLFVICQLGDSSFLGRCRKNIKGPGAHNDGGGL